VIDTSLRRARDGKQDSLDFANDGSAGEKPQKRNLDTLQARASAFPRRSRVPRLNFLFNFMRIAQSCLDSYHFSLHRGDSEGITFPQGREALSRTRYWAL